MINRLRVLLVVLGVIGAGYGGWLLVHHQSPRQVLDVVLWALAAIIIHDALLAPGLIAAGWLLSRYASPTMARVIIVTTAIVGPLLVSAFAVLLRPEGAALNPTIGPRNYGLGLVLWSVAVAVCVIVWSMLSSSRRPSQRPERKATHATNSGR